MKRALSFMLALIMVLSLVPAVSAAAEDLTTKVGVTGLTVTAGDTESVEYPGMAGSGTVEWSASSSQITAVATPDGERVCATLTLENTLDHTAILRFDYAFSRNAEEDEYEEDHAKVIGLDGDAGSFAKELKSGEAYTLTVLSTIDMYYGEATLNISNISLSAEGEATVTFAAAENGTYTVGGSEITGETSYTVATGTKYAVSATAASGYRFFGWYDGTKYLSYKAADNITISENCTISPVFIKDDVAVFGVGIERFQSLTEADTYASSSVVKTIVLMNDGILTGEHTISAGNTLLIPYDDANSVHIEATPTATKNESGNLWENKPWEKPVAYRTLTMAAGAKLTIQGSLNVGGKHSAGPFLTAGSPSGNLGMIQMAADSSITVTDGGVLYCWGYIYGDGTVTVKNGAKVHENIQFADFRGGNATAGIAMSFLVFPMTQYYVQNIEVATTYEYGAIEEVWGSIFIGTNNQAYGTSVKFIGPDPKTAMFVPGTNGSVTKTYIPGSDRLQMDVNGGGSINPMTLDMEAITSVLGAPLNTATFVLPITNNMTINVKSGTTTLNQSLGLLPGVELNISMDAVLHVNTGDVLVDDEGNPALYTGGHNLIVYDRDQWLSGWVQGEDGIEPVETYYVYNGKRLQPVAWSPTCSYTRTEADLVDAVLDINGSLITDGFVYTTVNIEPDENPENELGIKFVGNTPIISSGKTGKIVMNNGAGVDLTTMQATQNGTEPVLVTLFMVSARLQNADGSYLDTMGAEPGATFNYCANCDQWYAVTDAPHTVEIFWIADGERFSQEACVGSKPVFKDGTVPEKKGHEFIGWSTEEDNEPEYATTEDMPVVTGEVTYWACFREVLLGDVNQDDKLDEIDLTILAKHVAGIAEMTDDAGLAVADMNQNGIIDAYDLTMLARAYVDQYNASKNN